MSECLNNPLLLERERERESNIYLLKIYQPTKDLNNINFFDIIQFKKIEARAI